MVFLSSSKPTKNVCVVTRKKCAIHHRFFLLLPQELVTEGLESTLIRNLTDHLGNNLLHCVCSAGHTPLLPLLTSRFGTELTGALSDENRKGLTPVQIAIKVSRQYNWIFLPLSAKVTSEIHKKKCKVRIMYVVHTT